MRWIAMLMLSVAFGWCIPVSGQEAVGDPEWTKAGEIFQALGRSGKYSKPVELIDAWLDTLARNFGPDHPLILKALYGAGEALYSQGLYHESLHIFEQEVELSTKTLGADHPDTTTAINDLAKAALAAGDLPRARKLLEGLLETMSRIYGVKHRNTLTIKANLAEALRALGHLTEALSLQEALLVDLVAILGEEHPDTLLAKNNLALTKQALGDFGGAYQLLSQALATQIKLHGEADVGSLTMKSNFATALLDSGDFLAARQLLEEVFDYRKRVFGNDHPKTLIAESNFAEALYALGEWQEAKRRLENILPVFMRTLGEDHPETLTVKNRLGRVLTVSGEPLAAAKMLTEVTAARNRILGEWHPATLESRANLAESLQALGDLSDARQNLEDVLTARRRMLGENHPDTLRAKVSLTIIMQAAGDLKGVLHLERDILNSQIQLFGEVHPDTLATKNNIAVTLQAVGDLVGARRLLEEVLSTQRQILSNDHPEVLKTMTNLTSISAALGDRTKAIKVLEEVLRTSVRTLGKYHPVSQRAEYNLAVTTYESSDLETAKQYFEDLLDQRHENSELDHQPNTEQEALYFFHLGLIYYDLGLADKAYISFTAGLGALEAQALRTDFSEDLKSRFRARYANVYRWALTAALQQQKPADGLCVLERYRTQSLLALIRWSRPGTIEAIPEEYRQELANIASRYDPITRQIDLINRAAEPNHFSTLLEEQAQLRRRREVIEGKIIEARRAEEDAPQPLKLEEIRRHLDPGTLMLAYSIGEETSYAFALTRDGALDVYPVEANATKLWLQVARLRAIDLGTEEESEESRRNLSIWLYDKLLRPAAERIAQADRVLILPDGPLNLLHFPSLTRPVADDPRGWQYLVEQKPIHIVQSATVYAELQNRRPQVATSTIERPLQWVGIGDPIYPAAAKPETQVCPRSTKRSVPALATIVSVPGLGALDLPKAIRSTIGREIWTGLEELPCSEHEIREIAAQFPAERTKILLGTEATEDHAREILGSARIAHFATHGLADPLYPMDSFLALSLQNLPGGSKHNGLLQAWEITDDLKLDADLVVLSACQTAFGPDGGGEGLLSLSRAFQIAGARSVLASLWAVNDASTSELMIRFYKHLLAGEPKDRALQLAQIELIRGPVMVENEKGEKVERDFSKPYYWGAFQLIGDWQ